MESEIKEEKIGLFDLDGSLADFESKLRRDLEAMRAPEEPELAENMWDQEKLPHIRARMRAIKAQPGWWSNLDLIYDGVRIFKLAQEIGFSNEILTKGPSKHPLAWAEKVVFVQQRLNADIPIHIVSNKQRVYGSFLYDDFHEYVESWLTFRPRGLVIMPTGKGNKPLNHPNVVLWDGSSDSFFEVKKALTACYTRKPGEPLQW